MMNNIFKFLMICLFAGILLISFFSYKTYEKNNRFHITDNGTAVIDRKTGIKYVRDPYDEYWIQETNHNETKIKNPFDSE